MPGGPRSPIEKALREMASVYRRVGSDRSLSMDETIDIARRISRRELLRWGGVGGAGLLLAACTSGGGSATEPQTPPSGSGVSSGEGPRIVIVGAGLAGLTAAYRLRQAGLEPVVYEARDRVGGRCWSARDFDGGQVGEHGGEFIDTRHVHLRLLAEELGLRIDDLWEAWVPGSSWLQHVDGELVKGRELLADMQPAIRELVTFAEDHGPALPPNASPEMVEFDEQTMADWFAAEVGSVDSAAYRLWAAGQAGWWGLDPDQLGGGNLIDFYTTEFPGGDERYTVHGGNDQVPARMLEELPPGSVTLNAPLEGLRMAADGTYELRFAGVPSVTADRVILTLPWTTLRHLDIGDAGFSPEKTEQIEQLGMGTNAKVLLQFDRPFPMGSWSGGMQRGDAPNFGTWESGGTDPGAAELGLLTVFTGGRTGASYAADAPHAPASDAVVRETLGAIDEVIPGTSAHFNGTAWLDFWAMDPWVGGSYAAFLPGQMSRFFGLLGAPEGGVHFAGEHTSAYSQGYLNGGVESGSRAAAEVLEMLGEPLPEGLRRSLRAAEKYEPVFAGG